ncbi:truncated EP153R [African swine fever virus]|nr:truncated EP153R [African swine fever virus]
MFSNKKYIGLINKKEGLKKKIDDYSILIIGILIGTNILNYCKQLNSTLTNNNTILVNLTKTLNLTKTYNHESNYWVNYSLIKNESVLLRDSGYYKKQKHVSLLYICSK